MVTMTSAAPRVSSVQGLGYCVRDVDADLLHRLDRGRVDLRRGLRPAREHLDAVAAELPCSSRRPSASGQRCGRTGTGPWGGSGRSWSGCSLVAGASTSWSGTSMPVPSDGEGGASRVNSHRPSATAPAAPTSWPRRNPGTCAGLDAGPGRGEGSADGHGRVGERGRRGEHDRPGDVGTDHVRDVGLAPCPYRPEDHQHQPCRRQRPRWPPAPAPRGRWQRPRPRAGRTTGWRSRSRGWPRRPVPRRTAPPRADRGHRRQRTPGSPPG